MLLYPTLETSHYKQHKIATGDSTKGTPRVYKHRTGAASNLCSDQHPEFAILITTTADSTRSSKLYFGQPFLDFQHDKMHDLLIFKNMRCLNYTSSVGKPSKKDLLRHLDPEGGPDMLVLKTENLYLTVDEGEPKRCLILHVDGLETDRCHFRSHSGVDGSAYRLATPVQ